MFTVLFVVFLLIVGLGNIPTNADSNCLGWNQHDGDSGSTKNVAPACGITTPTLKLSYKKEITASTGLPNSWVYSSGGKLILQERQLHCYDIKSGKKLWDQQISALLQIYSTYSVITNDSIFYGTMIGIKGVDLNNGRTKFDKGYPRTSNMFVMIGVHPKTMFYKDQVYVTSGGKIFKLNPKTHNSVAVYETGDSSNDARPFELLIANNKFVFDHDTSIDIVNMNNTRNKKSYKFSNAYARDIACNDDYVFVALDSTDSDNTEVVCIDIDTGKEVWSHDYGSGIDGFAVDENKVYYSSYDGKVYCVDQNTGDEKWVHESDNNSIANPILCGNGLFVTSRNRNGGDKVYRLDASNGKITWEYKMDGTVELNTILAENRLVAITRDMRRGGSSNIYCFEKGAKVSSKPAEIVVNPTKVAAAINDSFSIDVSVFDKNKSQLPNPSLDFSSSDTDVCTVDKDGVVKAIGAGECKINISCDKIKNTVDVKVFEHAFLEIMENEINFGKVDFTDRNGRTLVIKNNFINPIPVGIKSSKSWIKVDSNTFDIDGLSEGHITVKLDKNKVPLGHEVTGEVELLWAEGEAVVTVTATTVGPSVSTQKLDVGIIELNSESKHEFYLDNNAMTNVEVSATTSGEWLSISKDSYSLGVMDSQKIKIIINTERLELGQSFKGKVTLKWRDGGYLEIPVTFSTPADEIAPEVEIKNIPDQINAEEIQLAISTNEPCNLIVNGEEFSSSAENENVFKVMIPLIPAPSITEIQVTATDLSGNETTSTVTVRNIKELEVKLQINSNIMVVDGVEKDVNPAPTIISGSTMVPVRAVSEAFGADVDWIAETKSIVIILGDINIILTIGSETAIVGDSVESVSPPPQIVSGRTMLPFRFIAEALGATVEWDGETKTITMILRINPN
jgi:outer membrane protein assembly factor BamB